MSWQARLVAALLRLLTARRDHSPGGVHRELAKAKPKPHAPKPKATRDLDVEVDTVEGMPLYRIAPTGQTPSTGVFYCHGGSYTWEISPLHWTYLRQLALEIPATVYVPIYPLAPATTAGTTVPATARILEKVVAEHGAGRVTLMGDSAGGGLALAVAQLTGGIGLRRLVLLAPWLDAGCTDPRQRDIEPLDHMLWVASLAECGRLYAGDLGVEHPFASPLNGELTDLPPTDVFVGTHDILLVDARRLAERAGPRVALHEGQGMQHVWPLLPFLPEGKAARQQIVELCRG